MWLCKEVVHTPRALFLLISYFTFHRPGHFHLNSCFANSVGGYAPFHSPSTILFESKSPQALLPFGFGS